MKLRYDPEVDALYIRLNEGVILDDDANGDVIGMEILNASKKIDNPCAVEIAVMS